MKPKLLWLIAALLVVIHLVIQYEFLTENRFGRKFFTIEFVSSLFAIACSGLVLGALIALIPYKQITLREKFKITFPLLTSVVLVVWIAAFSYSIYLKNVKGLELRPLVKYENITIPDGTDCSSVHEGHFETEKSIIERTGNKQIQTNKQTGQKSEFIVEWFSDCEYYLTSTSDNSDKLKIKITNVKSDSYGCFVIAEKYADKYPNFMTMKRLEGKSEK